MLEKDRVLIRNRMMAIKFYEILGMLNLYVN